jgi:membrane protease YdiL (CAAX protease family)
MSEPATPPGYWKTVWLMLRMARRRSEGRRLRQRQLLQNRSQARPSPLGFIGVFLAALLGLLIHGSAAFLVYLAVHTCQRYDAERGGNIVVSATLLRAVRGHGFTPQPVLPPSDRFAPQRQPTQSPPAQSPPAQSPPAQSLSSPRRAPSQLRNAIESEAKRDSDQYGGSRQQIEDRLWHEATDNGGTRFISANAAEPGLKGLTGWSGASQMIGSLMLLLWLIMMICQGEGMELDLQRRRHPMWEWLLSHPLQPGAVFLAEMLAPLSANPIYWFGPAYAGALYGMVYGVKLGFCAALLAGVPITVGAACLGKALEIGVMIRFAPRSRGGILGLMSWLGYAILLLSFAGFYFVPRLVMRLGGVLELFGAIGWPWLRLFLGGTSSQGYSFAAGLAFCWILAAAMTAAGVAFSLWGTQKGLSGNYGQTHAGVSRGNAVLLRSVRDPLYRKEFLWFLRDRSAIVQAVLIPITAAGYQIFNLRGLLARAQGEWNYLSGAAICFGTYFLWVLGPKSLTSEGQALWIPMTWPRGLESLLKAKAWLWAMISTGIVTLVMAYAAILFPADIWKIVLVLIGWFLFARSMAEKSVTLVTVASSSGEMQKIPTGRRFATQMGMLTFSIGIMTQQWHLAIVGIVFSYLTASAMWQGFRARLPYLYDPWSEQLPPPPTLVHAMVSISVMLEVTAILTAVIAIFGGQQRLGLAMLFGYGVSSVGVCLGTMQFLYNRGVPPARIWNWPAGALPTDALPGEETEPRPENYGSILWADYKEKPRFTLKPLLANLRVLVPLVLFGAAAGALLGMLAHGYTLLLQLIPSLRELLRQSSQQMANDPDLRLSYGILAVCFAPFAEEYLFRGLLFRALDREWGGWKAVLGSAAFFTIYHPPLAWIPVFTVGTLNALLFKKTGKLLPAVALHMAYNLVVSTWS